MRFSKKLLFVMLFMSLFFSRAWADTIRAIEIQGAGRFPSSMIKQVLPFKVGDQYTQELSNEAIQKIVDTQWVKPHSLVINQEPDGDVVIRLEEYPEIHTITYKGNDLLPTHELKKILKEKGIDLEKGGPANALNLKKLKNIVRDVYLSQYKYNYTVNVESTPVNTDQVDLVVNISEGKSVVIKGIDIDGNHAFSTSTLLGQLPIDTHNLLSWFTKKDQLSQGVLEASQQAILQYYLERGYFKAQVSLSQSWSSDKEGVDLTFHVVEGDVYKIGTIQYKWAEDVSPKLRALLPDEKLDELGLMKALEGKTYSQKAYKQGMDAINRFLQDHGYYYSGVLVGCGVIPQVSVDPSTKRVSITFIVNPGPLVYVQHIRFRGNDGVNDKVLRRVMQQPEGALYSATKVDESTRQLKQLPYLKNVPEKPEVTRVPGTNNQVDLTYKVEQQPAASISLGLGYSQLDKVFFQTGFTQQNFLGGGSNVGLSMTLSKPAQSYSLNYFNPYFTRAGLGLGYSLFYNNSNFGLINVANYLLSSYGATTSLSVPITLNNKIFFQGKISHTGLKLASSGVSTQLQNFSNAHGTSFSNAQVTAGWTYSDLDQITFPNKGFVSTLKASVAAPLTSRSFSFYKTSYSATYFHPLFWKFIGKASGKASFGNGFSGTSRLPFYENYFLGGIDTVAGYEGNTLGPLDSTGQPLGGNAAAYASLGLIIPTSIQTLRMTLFVDGGNVYNTRVDVPVTGANPGAIRYSAGIEATWNSPLGMPLVFSLAKAINPSSTDQTELFQFTIGSGFGGGG